MRLSSWKEIVTVDSMWTQCDANMNECLLLDLLIDNQNDEQEISVKGRPL